MQIVKIFLALSIVFNAGISLADENCLQAAATQTEMNACAGLSFEAADKELNRVYDEIKRLYADDQKFLASLRNSQLLWIKLRDADLELNYPAENKRLQYGSAYPMCASSVNTTITVQRIEFLKKWTKGTEEPGLCSGSIKSSLSLKK